MGSRETPSQRDPKVSSEGSQNRDLVNASLKEGSLNPRSGAQDLSLLKSSTKEASLDPLSSVEERKLPCGSTPSRLKRKIAEMETKMASSSELIQNSEGYLAIPEIPEELKLETRQLIIQYRKRYADFEQRRNRYQRSLMRSEATE